MSNALGHLFRLTSFGESHGPALGGVLEGCPAGLAIDEAAIQADLARRRPGQSAITTQRKEGDAVQILSGVFEGYTTGTPISLLIFNTNQKPKDYAHLKDVFRPSHADYTYHQKYGHRDYRGGGRAAARETAIRVAAGSIAKQFLQQTLGTTILAWVSAIYDITLPELEQVTAEQVEANPVRCPDPAKAEQMEAAIREARKAGDTLGGVITARAAPVPAGLGEPVFDKLHARLGYALLGINAVKGFEIGSGFGAARMRGSEHNDPFVNTGEGVTTTSNNAGGVLGGISSGQPLACRVAFKPVATLMQDQASVNTAGEPVTVAGKGRHDPCVVPRAVPIVEAMLALVLADMLLLARADNPRFPEGPPTGG